LAAGSGASGEEKWSGGGSSNSSSKAGLLHIGSSNRAR